MAYSQNAILTKSRAMYSKHLTEQNFDEMLDLSSVSDVANYLFSNTAYREVLQTLTTGYVKRNQLENALKKHMFMQFESLMRFEKAIGQEIYKYFIIKNEIDEIVSCIRLLKTPNADEYLMKMPSFLNKLTTIDLFLLAKSQSYDDIVKSVEGTEYEKILSNLHPLDGNANLMLIESALLKYLDEKIEECAKKSLSKKECAEFLKCVRTLSDIKNIQKIYRLKFIFKFKPERIRTVIISALKSNIDQKKKDLIINAETEKDFWNAVFSTEYGGKLKTVTDFSSVETRCQKFLVSWAKTNLRFSVNPSVVMFSWVLLKENEIDNIIRLSAGIKYKIPTEELKKDLNLPKEGDE